MSPEAQVPRQRRRRAGARRVTIIDVAMAAGVSAQTVSRVLNEPSLVGDATTLRVREAIAHLGYVPNAAASQIASNRSRMVAAIIPSLAASIFAETVQGLVDTLRHQNYQVLIGNTDYDPAREEEIVRSFLGRGPDGIVLASTRHTAATTDMLKRSRLPVVEAWDWTEEPIDLLVGLSNRNAAAAMVRHLHGRGYRRLAFAGAIVSGDHRAQERRRGFLEEAESTSEIEPLVVTLDTRPTIALGGSLLQEVLRRRPDTEAIFFSSDVFAAGAILAAARAGLSVPGDIAIAGFGDFEIAAQLVPPLTTVSVPASRIGAMAGAALLGRLRGESVEPVVDVGYTIVSRESA